MAKRTPTVRGNVLISFKDEREQILTVDTAEWFAWLETASSFAFVGDAGTFTARRERSGHGRGDWYWRAYRKEQGKLLSRYLGKSETLTLDRLNAAAQALTHAPAKTSKSGVSESEGEITSPALHALPHDPFPPLLATKLYVPRPRKQLVSRSHLLERLQQGMERELTLISAPAGFGKTTLLAQWIAESGTPVAWLSLEPEDNDPGRFLTYLIAALQTLDDQIGTSALHLLHAPQPPSSESVMALLTNDLLRRAGADFALVLDDYHVIAAESIHRALSFLLDHLPPQLHLVVATRVDPPLPLARLRARGQLFELRAAELQLSTSETETFLQAVMGLDLPPEAIATIERRTEGWVAGLQLAALSLQGRADIATFLASFTGSHRFILDYLSEEVLSRQPERVLSFLLQTSVLERLSGPLCDAVTEQEGSQFMLEALERANLFVASLDEERHWYRYHHLFADLLKRRLEQTQPELLPVLHRRASMWYEQHGFSAEAVSHMLAASDFEHAARLIEKFALPLGLSGQLYTVLGWLNTLPDALVRTRPFLCLTHVAMLTSANQLQAAEARLQDAEHCIQGNIPAEQVRIIQGHVFSLRSTLLMLSGDLAGATSLARQALKLLPETEIIARAGSLVIAAHSYLLSGDVTATTEREIEEVVALARPSGNLLALVRCLSLLAWMYVLQGRLRDASHTYEQVERTVPTTELLRGLAISSLFYYFGLGNLEYQRNNLNEAARHLALGMEIIKETSVAEPFAAGLGYMALARLHQARGNFSEALASLDAFMHLAHERHFSPVSVAPIAAMRAHIELAQGNLAEAISWADGSCLPVDDELTYPREQEYLTLARVHIAQGCEDPTGPFLEKALHLLERLLEDAQAKARMSSALEILILQALAFAALGNRANALTTLERALTQAEPEGYIRLFVDEGAPMLALLRLAQARSINPHYIATLIAAFGAATDETAARATPHASQLIEPFTEREREVLHLLLEGASNREIAHRLVVSLNTAKKHVFNICSKLGVQSRAQAIVKARTLDLL